ncbi:MAG: hypothetical protein ABEJ08_05995 [Halobacteriaceae archaeon]
MELLVEEEQSGDDETGHAREEIGFFDTVTGSISDQSGGQIGEAGRVRTNQSSRDQWHSVDLGGQYTDPVVFMQVMSYDGQDPCHVRLQNVTADGFQYQIEEWNYLDGAHTTETLGYVVLEAGVHHLPNGRPVAVGTTSANHAWKGVSFSATVGSDPVLISCCQTENGRDEVVTRNRRVTGNGAEIRLQEEAAKDGRHTDETVGYMVMPQTLSGVTAERTTASDRWADVAFSGAQPAESVVVASIDTFDGADPAGVRIRDLDRSGMELLVEEETSESSDMDHNEEVLGYWKIDSGPIYDSSGDRIGESGVVRTDQPDASQWHSVDVDGQYANPVVFMQVMSYNGANPCHTRLQHVDSNAFEFQIEEWNYLTRRTPTRTWGTSSSTAARISWPGASASRLARPVRTRRGLA